jgi:hypothetical protein
MDLQALEKMIALMRDKGVQYIKTAEVELYLGPEVPKMEYPKPHPAEPKIVAPIQEDPPTRELNPLYDHPALWGGGSRPTE